MAEGREELARARDDLLRVLLFLVGELAQELAFSPLEVVLEGQQGTRCLEPTQQRRA